MKQRIAGPRTENLQRLYAAGVRFISGSDAGITLNPFEDFAYNLTLLVDQIGLTPHAALQTATRQAAEALRLPNLGVLVPGNAADLIAVRGDPLANIHALWDIALVVARGRRYR